MPLERCHMVTSPQQERDTGQEEEEQEDPELQSVEERLTRFCAILQ